MFGLDCVPVKTGKSPSDRYSALCTYLRVHSLLDKGVNVS